MSLVLVTGGSGYFGTRPSRSWDGALAPPRRTVLDTAESLRDLGLLENR